MQSAQEELVSVFGFPAFITNYQLKEYFKTITPNINRVESSQSLVEATQKVDIYCTTYESALKLLEAINYNEFYGCKVHGYINNKQSRKARYSKDTNLFIRYGNMCEFPTEKELYTTMQQYGPVLSVKTIQEKRIAFCTFYNEEDAESALRAPKFAGIKMTKNYRQSLNDPALKKKNEATMPEKALIYSGAPKKPAQTVSTEATTEPMKPAQTVNTEATTTPKKQAQTVSAEATTTPSLHVFTVEVISKKAPKSESSSDKSGSARSPKKSKKSRKNPFIYRRQNSNQNISL